MCPSWNCTFPDPKRSICVDSSTTIYEILHLDVEGNNSWEWFKWCDAPESSIQLFKYAYKYWGDKACHLQNKEGLGIEIFGFLVSSLKYSSFNQHFYLACSPTIENTCFTWRLLPFLAGRFIELGRWRKIFYFLLRLGRQLAIVRRILLLII